MNTESPSPTAVPAVCETALSGQAPVAPVLADAQPRPKQPETAPAAAPVAVPKPQKARRKPRVPALVEKH